MRKIRRFRFSFLLMKKIKFFFENFSPKSEGLITAKLVIGLLVGLVICGVPLAVMSVLYVQASQFD